MHSIGIQFNRLQITPKRRTSGDLNGSTESNKLRGRELLDHMFSVQAKKKSLGVGVLFNLAEVGSDADLRCNYGQGEFVKENCRSTVDGSLCCWR